MSRSGYSDDCEDEEAAESWRAAVRAAFRAADGQAFLKELLKALDALPRKRLITNVLQEAEWSEDGDKLVPVKNGDVCAFGAVGRARGIEMPAELDIDDDDDWEKHEEVQAMFGTDEALTREIMYQNDECDRGHRVPIPNVREYDWTGWEYDYLPETPEERFARVRKWVEKQIVKESES